MPFRFKGFSTASAVALSVAQGGNSASASIPTWGVAGDVAATVTRYPAGNILPGEVVIFLVTGVTGYGGDGGRDLDFEWSFGDPGATFTVAQGLPYSDADTEFGRVVSHAYHTTGAKTATLTIRDSTGILGTQTFPITVDNPDVFAWTHDLYIDFGEVSGTPSFTGAPAVGGGVQHISTYAALDAFSNGVDTNTVRMTFKLGETFRWGTASVDAGSIRAYITSSSSFGTGARPKLIGAALSGTEASPGTVAFFGAGDTGGQSNCIIYGVDFEGGFNPVTGLHDPGTGRYRIFGTTNAENGQGGVLYRSLCQVHSSGLRENYGSVGTWQSNGAVDITYLGAHDVHIQNWSNYGISHFNIRGRISLRGCSIKQHPLNILRDGRPSGPLTQDADHGPIRVANSDYVGITNCNLASTSGWSTFSSDLFIQPCIRIYPSYSNLGLGVMYDLAVLNVQRNRALGSALLEVGRNNNTDSGYFPRILGNIDRNEYIRTRQHFNGFIRSQGARGLSLRNNVVYWSNVYSAGTINNTFLNWTTANNDGFAGTPPQWIFSTGADTDPIYAAFNTVVSDLSTGNTNSVSMFNTGIDSEITEIRNIVEVPNHTNGGTFIDYKPLSRGDRFKPATGSTAIDAVSSGLIPVRDFDGSLRTATTNIGAHHDDVASGAAVAAPIYTSGLTIAELAAYPGEYHVSNFGTWSNWSGDDQYMVRWSWQINGTPTSLDYLTIHRGPNAVVSGGLAPVNPATGNLTCVITATNRSGSRVSATSNTIVLA